MNRVLLFVILMFAVKLLPAQELITSGVSPDLHLTHQVAAKETWFAIARAYNLSPKQIATYNKLNIDKPLEVGTTVKIPLTDGNFTQKETKAADETLVPVFHVVQEKEWMYRISVNHNKVPIEQLEKWNSISRDEAKAGMKLIVGHLRVKDANGTATATSAPKPEVPAQPNTASQQPRAPATPSQTGTTSTSGAVAGTGGYFKNQFSVQGKNQSGVAGIFKSTSGWSDGKYYALMNNVTVGTIVRITLPQTNRTIFAKILGELPDMKESAGLALRISDAAAKELGAGSSKFSVDIAY
jgi:LysM repeat protein